MNSNRRNRARRDGTAVRDSAAANGSGGETQRRPALGIFAGAVLCLAGCSMGPLPTDAAGVSTVAVSSASVEIHRPRLIVKNGGLMLEAYALRQWKAETTADTHVDLVFLDSGGKILAAEMANFHPRSLPKTTRLPGPHAYLLVPMRLPPGTRAVEVRAHDGAHETPPSIR